MRIDAHFKFGTNKMTIEKISSGFILALVLGTAWAAPSASTERYVMFDKESTAEAPKCLNVERSVYSVDTYVSEEGYTIQVPSIKTSTSPASCTDDAKPYVDLKNPPRVYTPVSDAAPSSQKSLPATAQ